MHSKSQDTWKLLIKNMKEIYFRILPCIYKYKNVAMEKEEKLLQKERVKTEDATWNFKKKVLEENYQTKIMNFEGKKNILFEQIFEILNNNVDIVAAIILKNDDLITSAKIMKMFYCYFGGFNQEYFQLIGMRVMEHCIGDFFNYFYNDYIEKSRDSYAGGWEKWYRFIRKSRYDHPNTHKFINCMRWTLDVPEIRRYAFESLIKMSRIYINSKIQNRVVG